MTDRRSTQSVRTDPRHRGFTMAEMVVSVTIMVIVTGIVASLFVQVRKMIGMTQWGTETRAQLRTVVGTLAQDLENVDTKAYFIMLNRDYGWDGAQLPALDPTTSRAPLLYPDDMTPSPIAASGPTAWPSSPTARSIPCRTSRSGTPRSSALPPASTTANPSGHTSWRICGGRANYPRSRLL